MQRGLVVEAVPFAEEFPFCRGGFLLQRRFPFADELCRGGFLQIGLVAEAAPFPEEVPL